VYIFACFTPFSCRIKEWFISEKLKEYWSPEQIMGRLELDKKIFYRLIGSYTSPY
jgi:IS30 family transposase